MSKYPVPKRPFFAAFGTDYFQLKSWKMYHISPSNFFLCSLRKVISNSIICSLESQDLVIEWLDEDGGKKGIASRKSKNNQYKGRRKCLCKVGICKKKFPHILVFSLTLDTS